MCCFRFLKKILKFFNFFFFYFFFFFFFYILIFFGTNYGILRSRNICFRQNRVRGIRICNGILEILSSFWGIAINNWRKFFIKKIAKKKRNVSPTNQDQIRDQGDLGHHWYKFGDDWTRTGITDTYLLYGCFYFVQILFQSSV